MGNVLQWAGVDLAWGAVALWWGGEPLEIGAAPDDRRFRPVAGALRVARPDGGSLRRFTA